MANAETMSKLRAKFLDQPAEKHIDHWDDLWQKDLTPWDRSQPSVALKDAVVQKAEVFGSPLTDGIRKRALVPGCGRGYDVMLLGSLGYDAFGVDGSRTAVEAASKLKRDSYDSEDAYAALDVQTGRGKAEFILADFFKDDFLAHTGPQPFDVIFDYTFLCALPPELRPAWAKRMSDLLAPTGRLICLEWPLDKDPKEGGPPHALSSELYEELFRQPGRELEYDGNSRFIESPNADNPEEALVRIAHYMPERTHEAGKGKDHVSIWGHSM